MYICGKNCKVMKSIKLAFIALFIMAIPCNAQLTINIRYTGEKGAGAAANSWMQHLALHKDVQEGASNEWLEPVSDEQYKSVE